MCWTSLGDKKTPKNEEYLERACWLGLTLLRIYKPLQDVVGQ